MQVILPHAQTASVAVFETRDISSNLEIASLTYLLTLVLKPVGCQPWVEQCQNLPRGRRGPNRRMVCQDKR